MRPDHPLRVAMRGWLGTALYVLIPVGVLALIIVGPGWLDSLLGG